MRSQIVNYLSQNQDYFIFLRQNPVWHRRLTRYPNQLSAFMENYKVVRRKRFTDRLEDFQMLTNIMMNMPPESF